MLNKLLRTIREFAMFSPGDRVYCAVSGGADSVALFFALYLLREQLGICLEAVHFNHHLRGEESDRDEQFVRELCGRYEIPLTVGQGNVVSGKKGLEASAREARYAYFHSLDGKIATAHTADDNAETVLIHLIRGTGLKGLGGIAPVRDRIVRPMLSITRQDVLAFLQTYHLSYVTDSTNREDMFLRNRIRHHVMPLLKAENPRFSQNVSRTAILLREDAAILDSMDAAEEPVSVSVLRGYPKARRMRYLQKFLIKSGVREPETEHILQLEGLVFAENPSAVASFPGNIQIRRCYDALELVSLHPALEPTVLTCPGITELTACGLRIHCVCIPEGQLVSEGFCFRPVGSVCVRRRQPGDQLTLSGGTKSVKKLFIDHKIPAHIRNRIPVLYDSTGILGVYQLGVQESRRVTCGPCVQILFEQM